jgi:hypothetical protein
MSNLPDESEPVAEPAPDPANIVRYERRDGAGLCLSGEQPTGEVLFIDENTPAPELPQRPAHVPFDRRRRGGENVFYIGPE